jgi:hypothetical protein
MTCAWTLSWRVLLQPWQPAHELVVLARLVLAVSPAVVAAADMRMQLAVVCMFLE